MGSLLRVDYPSNVHPRLILHVCLSMCVRVCVCVCVLDKGRDVSSGPEDTVNRITVV